MNDPTPDPNAQDANAAILIIDDDPIVVQLLARALTSLGRVVFATNGLDGLEVATRHRPRVALIDADLPDITGYDIVKRLRGDPDLQGITLIMISAHSAAVVAEGAEDAGADGFLSKPIDEDELRSRLGQALGTPRPATVCAPGTPGPAGGFDMELVDSVDEELRQADSSVAQDLAGSDQLITDLAAFTDHVRAEVARLRQDIRLADSSLLHQLGTIDQTCSQIARAIGHEG
jgi:CheY-like chemotaxis protein